MSTVKTLTAAELLAKQREVADLLALAQQRGTELGQAQRALKLAQEALEEANWMAKDARAELDLIESLVSAST